MFKGHEQVRTSRRHPAKHFTRDNCRWITIPTLAYDLLLHAETILPALWPQCWWVLWLEFQDSSIRCSGTAMKQVNDKQWGWTLDDTVISCWCVKVDSGDEVLDVQWMSNWRSHTKLARKVVNDYMENVWRDSEVHGVLDGVLVGVTCRNFSGRWEIYGLLYSWWGSGHA